MSADSKMKVCRNFSCMLEFEDDNDQWDGACSSLCQEVLKLNRDLPSVNPEQALRYNIGKPRVSLVPFEVLLALADHYTVGAKKYEDHNWRKGLKYSDTMDSAMRHIIAFQTGEDIDEETGSSHLISAIWNLVALEYFQIHKDSYKEFDDRWKK